MKLTVSKPHATCIRESFLTIALHSRNYLLTTTFQLDQFAMNGCLIGIIKDYMKQHMNFETAWHKYYILWSFDDLICDIFNFHTPSRYKSTTHIF